MKKNDENINWYMCNVSCIYVIILFVKKKNKKYIKC